MNVLQDAINIKQSQIACTRRRFLKLPLYRQNTLFCTADANQNRWHPFSPAVDVDRVLQHSSALRRMGNEAFARGDFAAARQHFESTVAAFVYLTIRSRDINTFTDDDIQTIEFGAEDIPSNGAQRADSLPAEIRRAVVSHVSTSLVNLSITCFRLGEYAESLIAAQEALQRWPENSKAAYRVAWVLAKSPEAGGLELSQAVDTLTQHVSRPSLHASDNEQIAECRRLLGELRTELAVVDRQASVMMRRSLKKGLSDDASVDAGAARGSNPPNAVTSRASTAGAPPTTNNNNSGDSVNRWIELWQCPDDEVRRHLTKQVVEKLLPWLRSRGATGVEGLDAIDPEFNAALERYGLHTCPEQRRVVIKSLHEGCINALLDECDRLRDGDVAASLAARGVFVGGEDEEDSSNAARRKLLRSLRQREMRI